MASRCAAVPRDVLGSRATTTQTYDFIVDYFENVIKELDFSDADQKELLDVFASKRDDICGL